MNRKDVKNDQEKFGVGEKIGITVLGTGKKNLMNSIVVFGSSLTECKILFRRSTDTVCSTCDPNSFLKHKISCATITLRLPNYSLDFREELNEVPSCRGLCSVLGVLLTPPVNI